MCIQSTVAGMIHPSWQMFCANVCFADLYIIISNSMKNPPPYIPYNFIYVRMLEVYLSSLYYNTIMIIIIIILVSVS